MFSNNYNTKYCNTSFLHSKGMLLSQRSIIYLPSFWLFQVLDALHMDTMMSDVDSWRKDPESFLKQRGLKPECGTPSVNDEEEVYVLIVEGFLIFNYRYKWMFT